MKMSIILLWLTFLLTTGFSQTGYLKLGDIQGEATERAHIGWSEVLEVSHQMEMPTAPAAGPSRARQRISVQPIFLRKTVDQASVKISEGLTRGTAFRTANIDLVRASGRGDQVYMSISLVNARVVGYQLSASDSGSATESFQLNFEEMTVAYHQYDNTGKKKGTVTYTYNQRTN
jgi:type VI secretion system secreted protein Hcp